MKFKNPDFLLLSILSAALLSAGFLFPHCGGAALIGFVPLLWMDKLASERGSRHFWRWHYFTFVLWNAATTFWVCNATVAGGIAAILINALEMSVIWGIFRLSKKHFTGSLPYIFLVCIWIAWERAYFSAEISWPWLTLGNAFATTTTCVQWYEITGTVGGSLWIWCCNLAVFGLMSALRDGRWKSLNVKARATAIAVTALLFAGPVTASMVRYASLGKAIRENEARKNGDCIGNRAGDEGIEACALQPNLDPYLKFEKYSQAQQDSILCGLILSDRAARQNGRHCNTARPDSATANPGDIGKILYVAPETVTSDVVVGNLEGSKTLRRLTGAAGPEACVLFGASSWEFIESPTAPSYTARRFGNGVWYEDHNSALMAGLGCRSEIYHKSRLVIGTEKMPWPRVFSRIDDMLGGVIARCTGQERVSLLHFGDIPVGCAVCYESVYPEYFASYVAAGAKAMAVITNDAWWGDTPGYRQHCSYSRLRAIETRREIVRSANTGISCFINLRGDIVSSLGWDRRGTLNGHLSLNGELTPFVRHGDVPGRICTFLFLLLGLSLIAKIILDKTK